jgi:selenocysteine lyase/cysteine desulfurase
MTEKMEDFESLSWEPAASARRFECGSPNILCAHALHASIGLILETGMDSIERNVLRNTSLMIEIINNYDELELLSLAGTSKRSGIVCFRHRHVPAETLYQRLKAEKVICACRGGGIRFSPHFYTPAEQLERALAIAAGAAM